MNSSRLPGKVLLQHRGITMLELMVTRILQENRISKVVIATTVNPNDDAIVNLADHIGVDVFRGSENNVLSRVIGACENYNFDNLVALTGDCPLIDPIEIGRCIDAYEDLKPQYLSNAILRELPDGMDCQVLSIGALRQTSKFNLTQLDKEHVTLFLRNHPELFDIQHLSPESEHIRPDISLTLDEEDDFLLITKILEHFSPRTDFSLQEIIALLQEFPDLQKTNSSVVRKRDT